MANEPGKSEVANSGCPGLCLLRGITDLEGYLKLHMLLGEQNAKRQTRCCPDLRGPT
jgi:hypothetical protein